MYSFKGTPARSKQDGVKLKAFPRIRFKFVLKGDTEMEYQIVKREAFRIVGFRTPLPMGCCPVPENTAQVAAGTVHSKAPSGVGALDATAI